MKVLVDTPAFLWGVTDGHRLSLKARDIIGDGSNDLFLSATSGWEMAIKAGLEKLQLPADVEDLIDEQLIVNSMTTLQVLVNHPLRFYTQSFWHRDPFDRLLVAQAIVENLTILTADTQISKYPVAVICS